MLRCGTQEVDCDLRSFFDTVNHDRLMGQLWEKVRHRLAQLFRHQGSSPKEVTTCTYTALLALDDWVRRRVRLYYWKQWGRPRTRRRLLLARGADPAQVHMATRSRKGYWRMSANSIVQRALNNHWLHEQGVPDMRTSWIALHYGPKARA